MNSFVYAKKNMIIMSKLETETGISIKLTTGQQQQHGRERDGASKPTDQGVKKSNNQDGYNVVYFEGNKKK